MIRQCKEGHDLKILEHSMQKPCVWNGNQSINASRKREMQKFSISLLKNLTNFIRPLPPPHSSDESLEN